MIFFKSTAKQEDSRVIYFEAIDGDKVLGSCTLVLGEKYAEVTNLSFEQNAMFIAEGLLKSAYNYAALKNYYMAKCSVNGIDTLLKKLNFQLFKYLLHNNVFFLLILRHNFPIDF